MPKKLRKLLILTFSALLLAFVSLQAFLFFYIKPIFNEIFKESVSYYSSGIYTVSYDKLELKPLQQKVAFQNFQLAFDSSRVAATDSLRQRKWVSLSLDEFELSLDNFWTMVPDRYLQVNNLTINQPELGIYDFQQNQKNKSLNLDKLSQFDAHLLISDYFDSLDVVSLEIINAQLTLYDQRQQHPLVLGGIDASVGQLRIDANTVNRNYGYPQAEQFELRLREASFFTPDSLYAFHLDEISADPVKQQMQVKGFKMIPQKALYQFSRSVGHRIDRVALSVQELDLKGINLHFLLRDQAFLVKKIEIDQPELEVFKDKRLHQNKTKEKRLIQEVLERIPVSFRLDTLQIVNGGIRYREHVAQGAAPGGIHFNDLFASGYNITNLESANSRQQMMEVDVETRFMGESLLSLSLDVPLGQTDGLHFLRGEMHDLPLQSLNNMLENTAFTSVRSGFAYNLKFEMQLDEQISKGDLHFAYRDLKIDLLDKENPGKQGLKENVTTVLANWIMIKTNNPDNKREPLRIGSIHYEREVDKSIFNYWWKSLLTGIKGSVGMGNHYSSATTKEAGEERPGFFKRLFTKEKSEK